MKSIIYRLFAFTSILSFGVSCGDLQELNIDPNNPTSIPSENLVTQGQLTLGNLYFGASFNYNYGMLLVQHIAQNEFTRESRYSFQANIFDGPWRSIYSAALKDLKTARELIDADESVPAVQKANQLAVIDILMAFSFQIATDVWGDIPYSEALNGDVTQPEYDAQENIYSSLIETVGNAVSSISTNSPGFSSGGDLIYNGNMDGWQKFGNALLLRLGMRIADVNSTLSAATVSAALGGNIMSATTDEATLVYRSEERLSNPFWFNQSPSGGSRDDYRVSNEFLTVLQAMGDPRETIYADSTSTGEYIGLPYGLDNEQAFTFKATTSDLGDVIEEDPTFPALILRYSEVKFLTAEAIERGFVSGDAETEFNAGVTAAMNEWGITDATTISDYLTANPYDAANWQVSIGLQMWLAMYAQGHEAYATWRRLDQPILAVPADAVEPSIPVRIFYPTVEGATNQTNLGAVPYPDALSTRLWWDVN